MNEYQLAEYSRQLKKICLINENISTQVISSAFYLLKYAEKYNIKLPNKEALESIMFNTKPLLESHNLALEELEKTKEFFKISDRSPRSDAFFHEQIPDGDYTEPLKDGFKYYTSFLVVR